jgi:hypothetical protein
MHSFAPFFARMLQDSRRNSKQLLCTEREALTAKPAVALQEKLADHHLSLAYSSVLCEALECGSTII